MDAATDTSDVIIAVDGNRYALPLVRVSRVVRAVEVTPVPTAPSVFLGVIDVGGDVIPVVDLRTRLHLARRPIELEDCMAVVRAPVAMLVLPVDEVLGIAIDLEVPVDAQSAPVHADCIDRVLCDADGLVLGLDLGCVVTDDECTALGIAAKDDPT